MRGAPRKIYSLEQDGLRNLDENFLEIFRNAQAEDHDVQASAPAVSDLKVGQIKLGTNGQLWARIGNDIYEFTGVKL